MLFISVSQLISVSFSACHCIYILIVAELKKNFQISDSSAAKLGELSLTTNDNLSYAKPTSIDQFSKILFISVSQMISLVIVLYILIVDEFNGFSNKRQLSSKGGVVMSKRLNSLIVKWHCDLKAAIRLSEKSKFNYSLDLFFKLVVRFFGRNEYSNN